MLSEQILIDRAGNFTASENHRLMAGWDIVRPGLQFDDLDLMGALIDEITPMKSKPLVGYFSAWEKKVTGAMINDVWAFIRWHDIPQGLITYAQEKAMETLFEPDPSLNFETVHTRNGDEREIECMELLREQTGIDFVCIGDDQVHIHTDEIGCTPDGIVLDDLDLVCTGAEVKCKSPLVHAKNLLIENNDDLKEQAFDHYVQIQTAMLVTGSDHWYFANYNPFAKQDWMKFKYIIVGRDDDFIQILKQRIETAKQIKAEFLKKFKHETKLDEVA